MCLASRSACQPGFNAAALDAWLVDDALFRHTNGIARRDSNAWVLDGLVWWWPRSQHGTASAWSEAVRTARSATEIANFTPTRLHGWLAVRKLVGDEEARAFAGSSLAVLAERQGLDAVHRQGPDGIDALEVEVLVPVHWLLLGRGPFGKAQTCFVL